MDDSPARLPPRVWVILIGLALHPWAAAARAENPQGAEDLAPLTMRELRFDLGFEFRYEQRDVEHEAAANLRSTDQENTARTFEETLGLHTEFDVLTRNFLEVIADLRFGLLQERFTETFQSRDWTDRDNGELLEFDIRANLFQDKPVAGTVFATRADNRLPRQFLPSLDHRQTRYGTTWVYRNPTLPMQLTVSRNEDEYRSNTARIDDESFTEDLIQYEATWNISEHHQLRLDYEHSRLRQEFQGSSAEFDTRRDQLLLEHVYEFGREYRHRLDTLLRAQFEQGDLARDIFEFAPQLTLQHTDDLQTTYKYLFLREDFDNLDVQTHRADWGLTHQIYRNLTSTFNLYALNENVSGDADTREYGGVADWSYTRRNPFGEFSSHLAYSFDRSETYGGNSTRVVVNESATFKDPLPVYLNRPNVIPATIIVTTPNRARVFVPGRDYLVLPLRDRTVLVRIPTGRIANQDAVLLHYAYRVLNDFDVETHRLDYRVQQDFSFGLTPYYALTVQAQDLNFERALGFRDRDVTRHRIGLSFRRDTWSAGVEGEFNDDDIDPYDAIHLNGDWSIFNDATRQLTGRVGSSGFWFREFDRRRVWLTDVALEYRQDLTRRWSADAAALYRYENDSVAGETHGVDLTAALEYHFNQLGVRFEVEYDSLRLPNSEERGFALWVKVQRQFDPLITRGRL